MVAGYSLLTLKPLLLVLNVAEQDVGKPAPTEVSGAAAGRGLGVVVLSARVEMDIAQMPEAEQLEFVASLGLEEPARNRFVRAAYQLIDLIAMLTSGPDECRAWAVPRGTPAPRAAGKIHSDIERGFIRAEVVPFEDLIALGSEAKCREAGKLRVEGKDYVIQDGDVVHFRFNV
jgi:ribosome-binding ATPase YchF (GTP1/OBG family)